MLRVRNTLFTSLHHFSTASSSHPDHYKTLGIPKDATQKEIKAAFYDLSKKYHPDMNPDDREKATENFNKVAQAYEILGSADKREMYDIMFKSPQTVRSHRNHTYNQETVRKQYTDLDIDYKDFEHFQKNNRRRRFYHDHVEMPDEFFEKFGGRTFKSKLDEQNAKGYVYIDSRAVAREKEEKRIFQEIEEQRKKDRFPIPTFEQVLRQEAKNKAESKAGSMKNRIFVIFLLLFVIVIANLDSGKSRSAGKV